MSGAQACQWCGVAMAPSRQPKRFCSSAHRGAFHEGCRRFGERQFDAGAVSIEQLRGETKSDEAQGIRPEAPLTATGAPNRSPDQGDDHE